MLRPVDPALLYPELAAKEGISVPVAADVLDTVDGDEPESGFQERDADSSEDLDPEELARQFNAHRQETPHGVVIGRDLMGLDDPPGPTHLPPGAWEVEPSGIVPVASPVRETVTLPVIVRLMYDYARSQGWEQGDGSISAFITDVVLDYWENVLGLQIVVVDREEVERGSQQRDGDGGLSPAGRGPKDPAISVYERSRG